MLAENFAEQGGGHRNHDGFRGRQRSYADFYATDVNGFYLIIVLKLTKPPQIVLATQFGAVQFYHRRCCFFYCLLFTELFANEPAALFFHFFVCRGSTL